MIVLLTAIAVAIVCYVGFVIFFPKAIPSDEESHTRNVLEQVYEETVAITNNDKNTNIIKKGLQDQSDFVQFVYGLPGMLTLYKTCQQAGYIHIVGQLPFILIGMVLLLIIILMQVDASIVLMLATPIFAYYIILTFFKRKIRKRNNAFIEQFPDALDMIVRSVRSGFPMNSALRMVAENMKDPVREEFAMVSNDIALGRTINDALDRLASRINEPDLNFFIVVLAVQQETGGNLAEVISNLSNIVRKRKQLRLKIMAMTSEGRTTSWVLGALPVFLFGVLYFTQEDFLAPFFDTTQNPVLFGLTSGNLLLGLAGFLILCCLYIVRRMTDIEI